ncbi:hypothetical protein BI364_04675 [Acidihalobacter yilgarnensis]|uniref:DUF2065 domain-containing protein n=1 Tax=Acidihalobacter yilgarnensis TaxID=2819280 RepID=A0A1D8ILN1_9GAMM|nr:DUF2065 domain-containing protein [Acidihalobacter yilgarnensis]AOU97375.1 hypothetical protein BI364_04675 [Acidihalobacter yilgarnensis]
MWTHLLVALGLVFVLEGIFPFISPNGLRRTLLQLVQLPNRVLRIIGLSSMLSGLLIIYLFHR